jgi:hypothetical protein
MKLYELLHRSHKEVIFLSIYGKLCWLSDLIWPQEVILHTQILWDVLIFQFQDFDYVQFYMDTWGTFFSFFYNDFFFWIYGNLSEGC